MLSMFSRRHLQSMVRCAGSSVAGVAMEFGLLTLLVSALHIFYLVGNAAASLVYCLVSFAINRRWAFSATGHKAWPQFWRHLLVFAGGMLLGTPLLWLLVHGLHLHYLLGWGIGGALSFFLWTFPMQRWFTFRQQLALEPVHIVA